MARTLSVGLLSCVAACAGEGSDVPYPSGGKADGDDQTLSKGVLEFGEGNARNATINPALPFHAWELPQLQAGGSISIRTFKASPNWDDLDTTLFLFGPSGDGPPLLALDNTDLDNYAAVDGFVIEEPGTYRLVVSTAELRGEGHYAIEVTCPDGGCIAEVDKSALEPVELELSPEMETAIAALADRENQWVDLAAFAVASDPELLTVEAVARGLEDFYHADGVEWLPVREDDFSHGIAESLLGQFGLELSAVESEFELERTTVGAVERFWECEDDTAECNGFLTVLISAETSMVYVVDTGVITGFEN